MKVLESKTLTYWFVLIGMALAVVLLATGLQLLGVEMPYVSDLLQLIGLGGGAGTARNVVTDGVMPRMEAWKVQQTSGFSGPAGPGG